jgi:hypothetical protein
MQGGVDCNGLVGLLTQVSRRAGGEAQWLSVWSGVEGGVGVFEAQGWGRGG